MRRRSRGQAASRFRLQCGEHDAGGLCGNYCNRRNYQSDATGTMVAEAGLRVRIDDSDSKARTWCRSELELARDRDCRRLRSPPSRPRLPLLVGAGTRTSAELPRPGPTGALGPLGSPSPLRRRGARSSSAIMCAVMCSLSLVLDYERLRFCRRKVYTLPR
jgi:hypothetical protein